MSEQPIISEPKSMVENFIVSIDHKVTTLHVLQNDKGMLVALTNYGARIVRIQVPDRNGNVEDVVLGYDSIHDYITSEEPYFGATIGRCANRIADGKLNINNQSYTLDVNVPPNHLHGGENGYHDRVWDISFETSNSIEYHLADKEGMTGYPGEVKVSVSIHSLKKMSYE